MNQPIKFNSLILISLMLACFGLLPTANGTPDPATVGGTSNTADGSFALGAVTTGVSNSAFGFNALADNTSGFRNTAVGVAALLSNSGGSDNTAVGVSTLSNSNANLNTAVGSFALDNNQTGSDNTATGANALFHNQTGNFNTAIGVNALFTNTGSSNVGLGVNALFANTGSSNVGLGTNAGFFLTTGSGNICIGVNVFGVKGESNTTRIRNVFSSVASGRAVFVNSDNKLGTLSSSRRFKEEIKPMGKASETLFALKPVTFCYKKEVDPARALSFGLIAEDVAKVDPDLITCDDEGKPETVRYEAVNAMLLNEFLKEHRTVQELKNEIEALTATVKEQAALLQKVSAQIELKKPVAQTVATNQ